ncbi:MAG: flagellar biosynthetic protein FliO [Deltaproteobacteria bacterium]|nr:MAG: flagellar biosynthetic protein FliO [Deltaproteobacteria bacterium]
MRILTALILLLAQAVPVLAAEAIQPPGMLASTLKVLGSLVLVIGLGLVIAALAKKRLPMLPGQRGSAIRVLETRGLGPKKAVALVEVRGREFLLGLGADGVRMLAETSDSTRFERELDSQLEQQP